MEKLEEKEKVYVCDPDIKGTGQCKVCPNKVKLVPGIPVNAIVVCGECFLKCVDKKDTSKMKFETLGGEIKPDETKEIILVLQEARLFAQEAKEKQKSYIG